MCPHEVKVTAWLLGDLPPPEQKGMADHLERCAECRAVRDELAGVLDALRNALQDEHAVRAPARAGTRQEVTPARFPWSMWVRRAALLALSCGALFAAVALIQSRQGGQLTGTVTHITFQRDAGVNAPALLPSPAGKEEALSPLADFHPELPEGTGGVTVRVEEPGLPLYSPQMPQFPTLKRMFDMRLVMPQKKGIAPSLAHADTHDRRDRSKAKGRQANRLSEPPSTLVVKPFVLGTANPDLNSLTNTPVNTNTPAAGPAAMPVPQKRMERGAASACMASHTATAPS